MTIATVGGAVVVTVPTTGRAIVGAAAATGRPVLATTLAAWLAVGAIPTVGRRTVLAATTTAGRRTVLAATVAASLAGVAVATGAGFGRATVALAPPLVVAVGASTGGFVPAFGGPGRRLAGRTPDSQDDPDQDREEPTSPTHDRRLQSRCEHPFSRSTRSTDPCAVPSGNVKDATVSPSLRSEPPERKPTVSSGWTCR